MSQPLQTEHNWKLTSQQHFQRWAEHYDRDIINILLFKPSYRRVLAHLRYLQRRGAQGLRLLDIGCGTGTLMLLCLGMRQVVKSVVGLDMSDNMLEKAREKFARLNLPPEKYLFQGDAEYLPFADNSFDVVTCCNSFHHYPHKERAIAQMQRVLAPGGELILIDGYRDNIFGYFIFQVCVAGVEKNVYHCTNSEFKGMLLREGFVDIKQRIFGICPPAVINIARANKL